LPHSKRNEYKQTAVEQTTRHSDYVASDNFLDLQWLGGQNVSNKNLQIRMSAGGTRDVNIVVIRA
jgi:hypothetical protein